MITIVMARSSADSRLHQTRKLATYAFGDVSDSRPSRLRPARQEQNFEHINLTGEPNDDGRPGAYRNRGVFY
jgi:hypothetical protein